MCQRVATNGNIYRVSKEKRKTVKDFGSAEDFAIWAWYANRIGVKSFLELYFEQKSVMEGSTLRSPVKNGKDREESIWEMAKSASGTHQGKQTPNQVRQSSQGLLFCPEQVGRKVL